MPKMTTVTRENVGDLMERLDSLTLDAVEMAERIQKGYAETLGDTGEAIHDLTRGVRALADLQSKLILRAKVEAQQAELAALRAQQA